MPKDLVIRLRYVTVEDRLRPDPESLVDGPKHRAETINKRRNFRKVGAEETGAGIENSIRTLIWVALLTFRVRWRVVN